MKQKSKQVKLPLFFWLIKINPFGGRELFGPPKKKGLNFKNKNVAVVNTNNSFFFLTGTNNLLYIWIVYLFFSGILSNPDSFRVTRAENLSRGCHSRAIRAWWRFQFSVLKGREYLAIASNRILHHTKILFKKINTILNNQRKLKKYSEQGNNKSCNTISSLKAKHILYGTS